MLLNVIEIAIGVMMLLLAFLAINAKSLMKAIILLSSLSMLAVIAFVLMHAPDVAITEAVIGSGLVTTLFVYALLSSRKVEG